MHTHQRTPSAVYCISSLIFFVHVYIVHVLQRPIDALSSVKTTLPNNSMNESMRSKSSRDADGPYSSSGEELPPYQDIYLIGSGSPPSLPRTASLSEGQKRAQQIAQRLRMLSQRAPRTTLTGASK